MDIAHRTVEGGIWIVGWTSTIGASEAVTIASGVAAATGNYPNLVLDTEGGAGTDTLTQITGFQENNLVYVRPTSALRVITIAEGTYFKLPMECILRNPYQLWIGLCIGSNTFIEVNRSPNNA